MDEYTTDGQQSEAVLDTFSVLVGINIVLLVAWVILMVGLAW